MTIDVSSTRLDALTGLRFIAAAMILVHHAVLLGIPVPNYALDHGVSFFFVLSGFILTYKYPRLKTSTEICQFFIARVARIWPAHLFALLFAVTLLQQPVLHMPFLATMFLVQGWIPSWPWYSSYNGPSWSVSTEMFLYLAFPALILGWERSWWWKWLLSALLVSGLIALSAWLHLPQISTSDEPTLHGLLYINPLARLFEFMAGMVACSAFRLLQPLGRQLSGTMFTALEIAAVVITGYSIANNLVLMSFARFFPTAGPAPFEWLAHAGDVAILPFVVVIFAFGAGGLSRGLASRPLLTLGEMSYSIYLLHAAVFVTYHLHTSKDATYPDYIGWIVCVALTLALSAVSWVLVENPCRSAIKRLFLRPRLNRA